jgi:hypothetical protein
MRATRESLLRFTLFSSGDYTLVAEEDMTESDKPFSRLTNAELKERIESALLHVQDLAETLTVLREELQKRQQNEKDSEAKGRDNYIGVGVEMQNYERNRRPPDPTGTPEHF